MMFRKPMRSVSVHRFATVVTTLALSVSGLVFSPAQANVPVDGNYNCTTGAIDGGSGNGYYQINNGVVTGGGFYAGGCTGAVVIPDGVTSIGLDAFLFGQDITSVNIPASVTSIGRSAFHANYKLTSITIPANVTSIGMNAFWGNSKLVIVTFAPGSKLATIGNEAFTANSLLKSITIPASVTSIGSSAFNGSLLLTDVVFKGNAPSIGTDAFKGVASSATAYIKSGATGFTTSGDPARWNRLAVSTSYYENVAFDTKGGSTIANRDFGGNITEPAAPTRDCSTFANWSATNGGPAVEFPYTPGAMENITLHANWNLIPCAGTPGSTPNSKVVSIPMGMTEANIPANDALPAIKLNLAGATGQAVVTVVPISNPDPANSPFSAGVSTKVVDISVTGITGNVTVCLDGGAGDSLFHFTGGAWVALPERSYVNGQVCGVTSSFSPFTAAVPAKTPAEIAAEIAAAAAAAERARLEAEAAAELASRTISAKQKYSLRSLASQTGIKIVSPKAKVTTTVAGSSKKVCTKSGSTLKTLVAGNCVVTYTVQEPKQTIKSFKSFAVGEVGSGSTLNAKTSYSMNAIASANGISASAKGKLSMTVAKSSKGICSKSGSNLKMLKAGTCNVTFTVQEPQPAATKTTKTFVVK